MDISKDVISCYKNVLRKVQHQSLTLKNFVTFKKPNALQTENWLVIVVEGNILLLSQLQCSIEIILLWVVFFHRQITVQLFTVLKKHVLIHKHLSVLHIKKLLERQAGVTKTQIWTKLIVIKLHVVETNLL